MLHSHLCASAYAITASLHKERIKELDKGPRLSTLLVISALMAVYALDLWQ